jgi:hypothetical protein
LEKSSAKKSQAVSPDQVDETPAMGGRQHGAPALTSAREDDIGAASQHRASNGGISEIREQAQRLEIRMEWFERELQRLRVIRTDFDAQLQWTQERIAEIQEEQRSLARSVGIVAPEEPPPPLPGEVFPETTSPELQALKAQLVQLRQQGKDGEDKGKAVGTANGERSAEPVEAPVAARAEAAIRSSSGSVRPRQSSTISQEGTIAGRSRVRVPIGTSMLLTAGSAASLAFGWAAGEAALIWTSVGSGMGAAVFLAVGHHRIAGSAKIRRRKGERSLC